MKTTVTKKILGFVLSTFSIVAMAQCPTITNLNVSLGANGTATVIPAVTGTVSPVLTSYYWNVFPSATQTSSMNQSQGEFQFYSNGTYTVCLSILDSLNNNCISNYYCTTLTINNMAPISCVSAFSSYTDSNCVTHFINNSTGNTNINFLWYINGTTYSVPNISLNLPNGNYSTSLVTLVNNTTCDSVSQIVTVGCNTTGTTSCNAYFSYYTDTTCVTHFYGSPASGGYSIWNIDGMTYTYTPSVSLVNGNHNVTQFIYDQNGFICDSSYQYISVYCPSSSTVTPTCNASFVYYTDSTCVTYFYNTSVMNNGYVIWNVDGITYSVTPTVSLTNGYHNVYQTVYDQNGNICDTAYQSIYVYCQNSGTTTPVGCQVTSQFYVFPDSLNAGNYFAYNFSSGTGTLSYLWNFGDGTSSTQQYPFHQYVVPGQYVICLTVTSTSGTTTCTDMYCDSSSVQRMAAGFQMSQVNVIPLSVTSIKQIEKEIDLKAFPNPIADELTIEISILNDKKSTYILIDALGRTVLTGTLNSSKTLINTSNLEKGFYSLGIVNETGNSLKTIKLVK